MLFLVNSDTPAATETISGEVAETMNSGGYTYVRLEHEGKDVWAAAPAAPVEVGQTVTISTDMPMPGYQSPTLDRTFDMLYFVGGFDGAATGMSNPHGDMMGGMGSDEAMQHGSMPSPRVEAGSVAKAEGGHTIGELYASSSELAGKTATVRGRVVKFNGPIMGRNWIHVQDGTGDAEAKTHDLLVTTNHEVLVGDVITATGKVAVDKDFGSGYRYSLLLEEADVKVEPGSQG